MFRHLDEALANVAEQINKEVMESMAAHGFPRFDETKQDLLKGQVKALVSEDHPVRKLMSKSMLYLFSSLLNVIYL